MTPVSSSTARRPRPPAPVPRPGPVGAMELLWYLVVNPLELWTTEHFEWPVVPSEGLLGPLIVVSDPEAIRRVLVEHDRNYRKDALQRRILAPGLGDGLLTAEGDEWRMQRRTLAGLFTPRHVAGFAPAMQGAADALVARMARRRDGRVVNVAEEMARVALDVLERTLLAEGLGSDPDELTRAVTRYFNTFGRLDPLDILNVPSWVPRLQRLRGRPAVAFFDQMVSGIVARRRALIVQDPAGAPRDLLTLLLEASDPETGKGLGEDEIRANVMTFIAAGHETTANALTWTLFLLAAHPEERAKVEAEIDAWSPSGTGADPVAGLTATRAALEEAMRLYPPVPSITREAVAEDELAGRKVRAGTLVVISPYVLHRHRRLWSDPDSYRPERFLPDNRGAIPRFAYLPFGAGPRICIGASFALQEAILVLATLLRRFRFELQPGQSVEPVQRVTLRPKGGLPLVLRHRG
jgi:cytochrome P450